MLRVRELRDVVVSFRGDRDVVANDDDDDADGDDDGDGDVDNATWLSNSGATDDDDGDDDSDEVKLNGSKGKAARGATSRFASNT